MDTKLLDRLAREMDGIEELDLLIATRRRLRDVYSFLNDAYNVTANPLFLLYAKRVSGAGKQLNMDMLKWLDHAASLHAEYDDTISPDEDIDYDSHDSQPTDSMPGL